ncbi:MAG: VOC family protein [Candidatus Binataceae bacterium]
MLTGIDHMVIVVGDLDAAVADFTQLGFTVVRGGRHPSIGTHNALIAFADGAYFELIAFIPPVSESPHWWYSALQKGGGLTDFCVRTSDLESDAAAFRNAGATVGRPFRMGRERPDGYKVSWVLTTVEGDDRGTSPFFIRDDTPRDERVPRQRSHPNGVTGVKTLALSVNDANATARIYTGALGMAGDPVARDDVGAAGVGFRLGPHELQVLAPTASSGPLAERLRTRGPSPFEVTLAATGSQRQLDAGVAHGARIVLA